ncbi:kinase-like domain-containing protein [Tribonema minus]|uniref:Kinase-like domain-containing protein n=1 Tax=Tribonema minus TaxID=303371 RepID=A0A835ZA17_9STRA|nr:kinase-like domain-containing protein [Tribonema minus]
MNAAATVQQPSYTVRGFGIIKRLGSGATATVYEACTEKNEVVALKVVMRDRNTYMRELRVLKEMRHDRIVKLFRSEENESYRKTGPFLIVMELEPWGSLSGLVLWGSEAAQCMRDVAIALQYIHRKGYIHGDIKPANLLRDGCGRIKVCDFGCCKKIATDDDTVFRRPQGTPAFMSPEAYRGHGGTTACDVWSLAATIFCVVRGHPPFMGQNLVEKIMYGAPDSHRSAPVVCCEEESNLAHLVNWGLSKPARDRPSVDDVLHHPWMANAEDLRARDAACHLFSPSSSEAGSNVSAHSNSIESSTHIGVVPSMSPSIFLAKYTVV